SDSNADGDPGTSDEEDSSKVSTRQPLELKSVDELKGQEAPVEENNQVQAAAESETTGVESNSAQPETNPASQEAPQAEGEGKQDQSTVANTEAAKSTQGNLQALLARLTLSAMQELHAEVEAGLAAANAVLSDPKATQAQVDEQTRAMEALISRVNQALTPALENPPALENAGLTSTGLTSTGLATPDGAVTNQPTGGKRRRRALSEPTSDENQVRSSAGGNAITPGASSQATPQTLPTYTNTTEGKNGVWGLKAELEFIADQLRTRNASADKIQAAKAAADKFNEAFSKGDTISQSDFDAALADLKKSRDLIEGVLSENEANGAVVSSSLEPRALNGGSSDYEAIPTEDESARADNVTIQPRTTTTGWSGFRSMPADALTRTTRSADQNRAGTGIYKNKYRYYFEKGQDPDSPYSRYTLAFFNLTVAHGLNTPELVKDLGNYLTAKVTPTGNGFYWDIEINKGRQFVDGLSFIFTVPSGQTVKQGTVTVTKTDDQGTTSHSASASGSDDELSASLKKAEARDVAKGRPANTNAQNVGTYLTQNYYSVGSLQGFVTGEAGKFGDAYYSRGDGGNRGRYNELHSTSERTLGDNKLKQVINSNGTTYYGRVAGNNKYRITFQTTGNNDLDKLSYLAAIKGFRNSIANYGLVLHARTNDEKGFADSTKFRLKGNGYYEVDKNTAYFTTSSLYGEGSVVKTHGNNKAYSYAKYDDSPLDSGVKGVLTASEDRGSDGAFELDVKSYSEYVDEADRVLDKETAVHNAEAAGQNITWYKGADEISKENITKDAISTPGVHAYKYKVSYRDGSYNDGTINFVTKPEKPTIDTDIASKNGERTNVTVSNITRNSTVELYKKGTGGGADTLVATTISTQGGSVTFNNVDIQSATYYAKQKVAGIWYDRSGTRRESVYSDASADRVVDSINIGYTTTAINGNDLDRRPVKKAASVLLSSKAEELYSFIAKSPKGIKNIEVEAEGVKTRKIDKFGTGGNTAVATLYISPGNGGTRKVTVTATDKEGHKQSYSMLFSFPPGSGTFETTSEELLNKENEKPIVKAKDINVNTLYTEGENREWRAFLVTGGRNEDDGQADRAKGYDIVASTLVKVDGTAVFDPTTYLKDKIGDKPLRLVVAMVEQRTTNVYKDFISALSSSSIQAPVGYKQPPVLAQDTADTLEVTVKIGQGTANKATVVYFDAIGTPQTVKLSKTGDSWSKDAAGNAAVTITKNSDGTATVHIPEGVAKVGTQVLANQNDSNTKPSATQSLTVQGDTTAPKVSLGNTVLPTTANAATTPIYKVVQGSAFAPKLNVWDNIGRIAELDITNTPIGVAKQKFGADFQNQTDAKKNSKYSASTFSGNVADTQAVGQHTAQITVKDASKNTATYYLRYEVLPKVEARQAKFPQVKGKALQDGGNPETYIQFKNGTKEVRKPSVADVAWEKQPSTVVEGLDKTGVVTVTYHVTDENGQPRDEVKKVTISTPVYHATVKNGGVYTTTVGTKFGSSTNGEAGYVTSNFDTNVKYYWRSSTGSGYPEYFNNQRNQTADYIGKRLDTLRVYYPNSTDTADYRNQRSEDHVITFVSKPRIPSADAASLAGKANKTNQTVTVKNVTPGTTVKLYNGDTEIGSVDVPKANSEAYTDTKTVTITVNGQLPLSSNIRAKTIYMPNNANEKVESDFSTSVQSTTEGPQAPEISQNPEDLVLKSTVGQGGSTKVTLTYTDANGREKVVGFTKNGQFWDKDDANADTTVSITNESNGIGKIQLQPGTAQAGSTVTVKQKTATSEFSTPATTKALGRLNGLTNTAQADGSVEIRVPEDATRMSLTYTPQGQAAPKTLEYTKTGTTWTRHDGTNTYSDDRKIVIPKENVADGTTVSVIASNDSKTTTTVESKAKFEQPSATTSATRQNGDVEVTLPTDAEDVTLTYKNKQNTSTTVTLTKEGTNWTSKTNLPDGISLANGKVTFDYTKVNRDTAIRTASTRGKGDVESQANSVNHNIPEHTAPRTTNVVISANGTPSNEQLSAGVEANNKRTVVAKEQQTAIAAGTTKVVATTLTYQDGSSETVNVTVISKPTAPAELTHENKQNGTTRIKLPDDADKVVFTIPGDNQLNNVTVT
ncbi:hypothetical protein, partial [Streptococcus pseudopneumoniae]|uniref:hypothetical protein n=1 Tax=Streptococcus pseudopneumoniae TaxID=257758 RepID=UPI001486B8DB